MKRLLIPAVVAAALVVAACGAPDRTPAIPTGSATAASSSAAGTTTCSPSATASFRPTGRPPAAIVKRGYLVVGVAADTRLLGARNLGNNQFEGFDIDMAKEVAKAIFGDPNKIRFRAISAGDRVPLLQSGAIDMVARAMTMTCDRWKQVSFAGPYFTSYLRLLVGQNEKAQSLQDLAKEQNANSKKRVCATNGSTTLAKVAGVKGVEPVGVALTTDCMVLWQQGQVDAIAADDAILAGLADQDPNARIVGPTNVETEPYGLAVSLTNKEFAAYINGVLENLRKGGWQDAYKTSGLQAALGNRTQPAADFSRPVR
jgi:polar amino acid transport system substrate-binding protein